MRRSTLVLTAILAGACGGGGGGSPATGPVTVVSSACPSGPGSQAGTTCSLLRVQDQGNPPIEVELRVTDPGPGTSLRGTVVLGAGGQGSDFTGDQPGGDVLVAELLGLGFRVADRRWRTGWFLTGGGIKRQSARYAALLVWIHANVHTTGAFLAFGNSGGAAEIAYALTTWSAGSILTAAVLGGGPPMSRLDYLCDDPASAQWLAQCAASIPPGTLECGQPACTATLGAPVCAALPSNPGPGERLEDSILHSGATLAFPSTLVHGVLGAADCTDALPQALLFLNAVTTTKVIEYVPGTPHFVPATAAGRQAIERALLAAASSPRGAAATLQVTAAPRIGEPLTLRVCGPRGGLFRVVLGTEPELRELGAAGFCFVRQGTVVAEGRLSPVDGCGTSALVVPPTPALAGLPLYGQALAVDRLSNLARAVILR